MTIRSPKQLCGKCLQFFGKLTASLSHEINNVLAIINELNGLLEDFLAATESGHALDPDRLKNVAERIACQVDRGKQYVKLLNRFAHTVDVPLHEFDARDTVSDTISVCTRLTTLKKINMKSELPDQPVPIEANPFDLAYALHQSIELIASALQPKSSFTVRMEKSQDGFSIKMLGHGCTPAGEDLRAKLEDLKQKIEQLGGKLEEATSQDAYPLPLILHFPVKLCSLAFDS